jgi:hypothetical protein
LDLFFGSSGDIDRLNITKRAYRQDKDYKDSQTSLILEHNHIREEFPTLRT